jgi:hypothetical protein
MPTPNKGESERDFVKRCVPVLIDEGKKPDQAVAVCHSLYDEHKGMKHSRQWASASLVLSAPDQDFRDAVVLGQGLPMQREGQPVKYFWKEVLRPGEYRDKDGKQFEITANRIDTLHNNFVRAKQKGFQPWVPNGHTSDATKNMGFVIDARKNDKGGLDLLHQLIGSDAILAAQRNKSSIFTVSDYTDENGEHYDELILHNAICPDPQLSNLDDFTPALAASRGATANAVVLSLAASPHEEPEMDLTKLREAIGAGKEITDDKLIEQAVTKLSENKTLELSRNSLTSERDALVKRATDAEARVLELSKGTIPADYLPREVNLVKREIASGVAAGPMHATCRRSAHRRYREGRQARARCRADAVPQRPGWFAHRSGAERAGTEQAADGLPADRQSAGGQPQRARRRCGR